MLTLILILLCVSFTFIYLYFNVKYDYWKRKQVPYPKPIFVLGNIRSIVTVNSNIADICNNIYKSYKSYRYVGFFNLWTPALVIRDPELAKNVIIKQFYNFQNNWVGTEMEVDPALYYNPFGMPHEEWKLMRPKLTPQFTSSKIRSTFPQTLEVCQKMIKYIKNTIKERGSNTLEATELTLRFTGDNVMNCAYGLDGRSFDLQFPDAFKIGDQISNASKVTQIKKMIGLFFPLLRKYLNITFVGNPTPKIFKDIIMEAIKYRDQNNIVRNDYLDFLREMKANLPDTTDEELVGCALTFFLDGVDTGSLALSYALFEICLNPDVQRKARDEIRSVIKKYKGDFNYEALQEMEYIDNIVTETLRKHPIIKILNRVCTNDCKFPSPKISNVKNEVLIKKGVQVFIPIQSIHNDSGNYPDPEKFNPDRYRDKSRGNGYFFGFGDGPRICLGRRFAIQQTKAGIIAILSEFQIKLSTKTELPLKVNNSLHLSDAPKDGIWIDFFNI